MHADAVEAAGQQGTAGADDATAFEHAQHVRQAGGTAVQHRAGLMARHQVAVVGVGPVGKDLVGHPQARRTPGHRQLRQGWRQQDQICVDGLHRRGDGGRHRGVLAGHVVHRAVRLDVRHPLSLRLRHAHQRTHLVGQHRRQLARRQLHHAPAETLQVGERRVRAQADTGCCRQAHGVGHDQRIAGMEAASHVGRPDDGQQRGVVAHAPGAEAFAEVGVQVDVHGRSPSGCCASMMPLTRLLS